MNGIEGSNAIVADAFPFVSSFQLAPEAFQSMAEGLETPQAAEVLNQGDVNLKSIRLVYILGRAQEWQGTGPEEAASERLATPRELFVQAGLAQADSINALLQSPAVGAWLHQTVEQLQEEVTPEEIAGLSAELNALAAVAACRANIAFTCKSATRYGSVYLPTMGQARFKHLALRPHCDIWLESDGDGILRARHGETIITAETADSETWHGERRYHLPDGPGLSFVLDDLTPGFEGEPARRLSAPEIDDWDNVLPGAWRLLVQEYPHHAEELSRGLHAIKPLPINGITIGMSAKHGVGAVAMRLPQNKAACAELLIHEYAHIKLTKLEQLFRIFLPEAYESGEYCYAPWRDDPRPVTALLQGVYSFMLVAEFWQERGRREAGTARTFAQFEYARWLAFAQIGARQLVKRPQQLTKNGRFLVQTMFQKLQAQSTAELEAEPRALAAAAVLDHAALWRGFHLRVPSSHTPFLQTALAAWRNNQDPPAGLWETPARLCPQPSAVGFRARANVFRQLINDAGSLQSPDVILPSGASEADVQYALGYSNRAEEMYLQLLDQSYRPTAVRALVGLGLAWRELGEQTASRAVLERPELVRALMTHGGVKPHEAAILAAWVGSSAPSSILTGPALDSNGSIQLTGGEDN